MKPIQIIPIVLLLAACSDPPATVKTGSAPAPAVPAAIAPHGLDAKLVARGGEIYKANCAACHGANAEGAPNWSKKGADGKYPPPPLDASGHGWHHSSAWLADMIRRGTVGRGGAMPGWEGRLGDDDIAAVIAWMQSRWPEEIYKSWALMDERSGAGMRR